MVGQGCRPHVTPPSRGVGVQQHCASPLGAERCRARAETPVTDSSLGTPAPSESSRSFPPQSDPMESPHPGPGCTACPCGGPEAPGTLEVVGTPSWEGQAWETLSQPRAFKAWASVSSGPVGAAFPLGSKPAPSPRQSSIASCL